MSRLLIGILLYVVIGLIVAAIRAHKQPRFALPAFDLAAWPLIVWAYGYAFLFNGVPFFGGRR